ncbi:hypothetical protein U879_08340 [Defluviimonas sp. 20V17]|uniref:Uncharacterized protein n=1 Tax=Allgaiera indica TaxID=765699 RepID=A0AAN5A177_9RHOB|nr:hypothetical protein U879_08340 [Defluviimonas sp. 20V17]GHE06071.1 hypothetical protein GCM10008024_39270 [Allgaiera indica]SDX84244.1 hypothetical protein SAMN05444006_13319 [Allgaiera indica]
MQEEFIELLTHAIKFANLADPHPEAGVTRLQAAQNSFDARPYAVAALRALAQGGYRIVKDGEDA